MKKFKIFCIVVAVALIACTALSLTACNNDDDTPFFKAKMSFSEQFSELSPKANGNTAWRDGMVSGNGLQGFITSGSPYEDTLIYQNIHFILPNENERENPVSYAELETVRQNIVNGKDIVDNQSYDDVYAYHAGGILRISQTTSTTSEYLRYTDYETAEVGVKYTDENGSWVRTSFTSQADNVSITKISSSSDGKKVNATLSLDNISSMAQYDRAEDGKRANELDLQYKKIADENGDYLAFVAHYPDYENSELKKGGYATVCYIVCEGGSKEIISLSNVPEAQYVADENPAVKITDATNVYVIAVSDRTFDMGTLDTFQGMQSYELVDNLVNSASQTVSKYTFDGKFDYSKAFKAHTDIFTPLFNSVDFSLYAEQGIPNEDLIKAQRGTTRPLTSNMAEKAYYSGRYAYLCCAGYSTSRLYGMWTGEWNTGWGSKYTMDANVNLQTSSMNTSNILSAPLGYVNFILRQAPDWEDNAYATHGYTDALQAPVNTDGDRAIFTESCYPYPFRYWNAGTSWMLQPLYETLLCYGDLQVPVNDEFDLNKLKSVLSPTSTDLTDSQIAVFKERGYLNLKEDIMLPLLTKAANYWKQLLTPEYYTDANGYIRYEEGKTSLGEGETYCIIPSYSPENNPSNYPSPAVANSAIDIAACINNMEMLIDVILDLDPNADVSEWEDLRDSLPPFLFDETGALKEWAVKQFSENNLHRHLSHLYCVWPLNYTKYDSELKAAAIQAIENRASENKASHALVHRALISARLGDRQEVTSAMLGLMSKSIYYDSLMTNHHTNAESCYCTDFAIGYVGMVNECLVYSDENSVEILPSVPTSGYDKGYMKGLRLKIQAVMTSLEWDLKGKTAKVTIMPEKDCEITLTCGLSSESKTVKLEKGKSVTLSFTLDKA